MPTYSQYTLDTLAVQLGILLDDTSEKYWTRTEKYFAIWEALYVWGAFTNYWRSRGVFNLSPYATWAQTTTTWGGTTTTWAQQITPYYDLSVLLPDLRTRSWTLDKMVRDIQYMLMEAPNGILGAGASGQIDPSSVLNSIQRARNRFILDTHLPLSVGQTPASPAPPEGMFSFDQSVAFVHRVGWLDVFSGVWTNLWREDAWAVDKATPVWTLNPTIPVQYSESENSPLRIQLSPAPQNTGAVEIVSVNSLFLDLSKDSTTFQVPDEWVHAIKYAALEDLFSADSQLNDPMRAKYAGTRYAQSVAAAQEAKSILRALINNVPAPIAPLSAVDNSTPYWRNQSGMPSFFGTLYDIMIPSIMPDQIYGAAVDVVQSAPIPVNVGEYIPVGGEDIQDIVDYAIHVLTFKCGGNEFKATFDGYDRFMKKVEGRGQINKAKIRYLRPMFNEPTKDSQTRPDQQGVAA